MGKSIFSRAGLITSEDKKDLEKRIEELEQALGDVHDVRRQAERDAMRRERAVMSRIDDVERALTGRLDAMEAGLSREIAALTRSLSRDLAAFRIHPVVDTSALGTMMQKEIARQIAVMRAAQEKGAQDLKDSLARTLEYVASAQEQGFTDILRRYAAIEIGLVETAGQIAENIERSPARSRPSTRRSATAAKRRRCVSESRTSRRISCRSSFVMSHPHSKRSRRRRTSTSSKDSCACRKRTKGRRA